MSVGVSKLDARGCISSENVGNRRQGSRLYLDMKGDGFSRVGMVLMVLLLLLMEEQAVANNGFAFQSERERGQLIELYTSQGCSSCPPAEQTLNDLRDDPRLWKVFVPVAYHVDYWDRLGWRDPFASTSNTERQYAHKEEGNLGSVYTPAFVINGEEWRGYFQGKEWPRDDGRSDVLKVQVQGQQLSAEYADRGRSLRLNVAVVGVGIETFVRRGENRNRRLPQDFVVLWDASPLDSWTVTLPDRSELAAAERYGLAVWVTEAESLRPLQATGAWWDGAMAE